MKPSRVAVLDDEFSYLKRVKTITSRDVLFITFVEVMGSPSLSNCFVCQIKNGFIYHIYYPALQVLPVKIASQ